MTFQRKIEIFLIRRYPLELLIFNVGYFSYYQYFFAQDGDCSGVPVVQTQVVYPNESWNFRKYFRNRIAGFEVYARWARVTWLAIWPKVLDVVPCLRVFSRECWHANFSKVKPPAVNNSINLRTTTIDLAQRSYLSLGHKFHLQSDS